MGYTEDTETQRHRGLERDALSEQVIGCCIRIHQALGPGLLESVYERCLCHELTQVGLGFKSQVPIAVTYQNLTFEEAYRVDVIVEDRLVIELKAVARIEPVHKAQLLSYLKLLGKPTGLLINFHVPTLTQGIVRISN